MLLPCRQVCVCALTLVLSVPLVSADVAEARQASSTLPKELAALMPKGAGTPTGKWIVMATSIHGEVSATVRGTTACDEDTSQGGISITIDGITMPAFLKMKEAAYLADIAQEEAASREPVPTDVPGYSQIGLVKDESLSAGRIFYRQSVRPCPAESGGPERRTETTLKGFARKGIFFYKIEVSGPMPAAAAKALAAEVFANIQRVDLPVTKQ
jgi:hypothetical protein